jgi:cytochrome c oxidase subunit 1
MLFSVGFAVTFLLGGLSWGGAGQPPIDFHVTDTYFVVAHFHYVLFGTIVFATYAGIYFWFPKMTGRLLDERLGKLHFWLTFVAFHTTLLVQHWLGDEGMAPPVRRLPAHRRVHHTQRRLYDRRVHPRAVDAPVHVERVQELALRRTRHRRRSLGLRQLAGVGHQLPAAAAQLHRIAPHPLRAPSPRTAIHTWWSGAHIGHNHTEVHS